MKYWKSVLVWSSAATVITLFWLLALLPAQLLYRLIPGPLPLNVMHIQGTLWQGSLVKPVLENLQLDRLDWQLSPWSLPSLAPEVGFSAQGAGLEVDGVSILSEGQTLELFNVEGTGDLEELSTALAAYLTASTPQVATVLQAAGVEGRVELNIEEARMNTSGCTALEGDLLLPEVHIAMLPDPVGLKASLSCNGNSLVADISDTGELSLKARFTVSPAGRFQLNGSLSPANSDHTALLKLTGLPEQNGRFMFRFQ